jgi:hypothetical protein
MKEGIIIATVKYRYAKIGPCSDLCVSLFSADYMYINGKHDGILFSFLTVKGSLSIEKIKTEKPAAILHPVPPAPPPPNPHV